MKAVDLKKAMIAAEKRKAMRYKRPRPTPPATPAEQSRKAAAAFHARLRQATKIQRTPGWANLDAIRVLYERAKQLSESTGIPHHVDHFYPLRGRLVSGLHVAENLRVIPATDNLRKHNKPPEGADDGVFAGDVSRANKRQQRVLQRHLAPTGR